ncbi:MAG: hypothetical protein AAGC92_04210 [Pseudomonadota bacterium]
MGRILRYLFYFILLGLVAFFVYAAFADLSVEPEEREVDVPLSEDG